MSVHRFISRFELIFWFFLSKKKRTKSTNFRWIFVADFHGHNLTDDDDDDVESNQSDVSVRCWCTHTEDPKSIWREWMIIMYFIWSILCGAEGTTTAYRAHTICPRRETKEIVEKGMISTSLRQRKWNEFIDRATGCYEVVKSSQNYSPKMNEWCESNALMFCTISLETLSTTISPYLSAMKYTWVGASEMQTQRFYKFFGIPFGTTQSVCHYMSFIIYHRIGIATFAAALTASIDTISVRSKIHLSILFPHKRSPSLWPIPKRLSNDLMDSGMSFNRKTNFEREDNNLVASRKVIHCAAAVAVWRIECNILFIIILHLRRRWLIRITNANWISIFKGYWIRR